jgi:hypothetical protein
MAAKWLLCGSSNWQRRVLHFGSTTAVQNALPLLTIRVLPIKNPVHGLRCAEQCLLINVYIKKIRESCAAGATVPTVKLPKQN